MYIYTEHSSFPYSFLFLSLYLSVSLSQPPSSSLFSYQAITPTPTATSLATQSSNGLASIRLARIVPDEATMIFMTQLAIGFSTANWNPPVRASRNEIKIITFLD